MFYDSMRGVRVSYSHYINIMLNVGRTVYIFLCLHLNLKVAVKSLKVRSSPLRCSVPLTRVPLLRRTIPTRATLRAKRLNTHHSRQPHEYMQSRSFIRFHGALRVGQTRFRSYHHPRLHHVYSSIDVYRLSHGEL